MKRQLLTLLTFIVTLSLLLPLIVAPVAATVQTDATAGSTPPDFSTPQSPAPPTAPDRALATTALRSSPVMFIENVGQFSDGARFQVRGSNGTMWLTEDAIWITVLEKSDTETRGLGDAETLTPSPHLPIPASLDSPPSPRFVPIAPLSVSRGSTELMAPFASDSADLTAVPLADTPVGGPIVADTTWTLANSPYLVIANVQVMSGVTLTIQAGVVVKFDQAKILQVDDTLIARGTASQRIIFTSSKASPTKGDWGGIVFSDSSVDATFDASGNYVGGSVLQYCVVEYGGSGVESAIHAPSAAPYIDHCTVQDNASRGIRIAGSAGRLALVSNNTVSDNSISQYRHYSGGGIYAEYSTVSNNIISGNSTTARGAGFYSASAYGGGIYASTSVVSGNTVRGNSAKVMLDYSWGYGNGGGVYASNSTVSANVVSSNFITVTGWDGYGSGGGIAAHDSTVNGNTVSGNSASAADDSHLVGGGIYANRSMVANNTVSGNSVLGSYGNLGGSGGGIYASVVSNNVVNGNLAVYGGGIYAPSGVVSNNAVNSNSAIYGGGIYASTGVVSNNAANNNSAVYGGGIFASEATVVSNTMTANTVSGQGAGLYHYSSNDLTGNTVIGNSGPPAQTIGGVALGGTPQVHYNNLYGNSPYDVVVLSSYDISGTNNYWGTTNSMSILAQIYDWYDNTGRGRFLYIPYLQEPVGLIYSISGRVTDGGGNPIAGTTVSGGSGRAATTNDNGYYTLSRLPAGTYILRPSKSGYTFFPAMRTVILPPHAAGQDFTGTGGAPPSRGVSSLNPLFPLVSDLRLRAEVVVANPGPSWAAHLVEASLWQGVTALDMQTKTVTVAPGSNEGQVFNFGRRSAGNYQLQARIFQSGILVDVLSRDVAVLESADQLKAKRAGQRLTDAAQAEFDEARGIVVTAYADSVSNLPGEATDLVLRGLFLPLRDLGNYAGVGANELAEVSTGLHLKLFGVESLLQQTTRRAVEENARGWVDNSLALERSHVQGQAADYNAYVASHVIFWDEGRMAGIVSAHERAIRSRVEWEPIPVGVGPPPLFIAPTTLKVQALVYRFYGSVHGLLGILAILAGLAAILVAVVGMAGVSVPALIAGLAAVGKSLQLWLTKPLSAIFLVVLALVLHFQSELIVAPVIAYEHSEGLSALRRLSTGITGQGMPQVNTAVQVRGHTVDVTAKLHGDGALTDEPFVETYIYTADGQVAGIFDAQPRLAGDQAETISWRTSLPPGQYRAVTVVHAGGQLATTNSQAVFAVDAPQVSLEMRVADAQLAPGQVLEAVLAVTNTNPLSPTGELVLFAQATTGDAVEAWSFNLATGAATQRSWRFVPQTGGAAILRASVLDAGGELAFHDVAYVVGTGAAVALNLSTSATNTPRTNVPLTLMAINAGTQPTTTLVSLETVDRESSQVVYARDVTLTLSVGQQIVTETVILPVATPGSYAVQVNMNDQPYRTVNFLVSAQDTLYASVAAHSSFVDVGQAVTLTATIVNSVFTYTDALPVLTLQDPSGVTQTVPITQIQTGQYQGQVTTTITGTYEVSIRVDAPDSRVFSQGTAFAAGQGSRLQPLVTGSPTLSQTTTVTITVSNENDVLLPNVSIAISSTAGSLTGLTDPSGSVSFSLIPQDTAPYTVTLAKDGYGEAVFVLPVQIVSDTTPPALFLDAPSITNQTPFTVTGLTEAGAMLILNTAPVPVDAQGRFTTSVSLSEGANVLRVSATDPASNTTTLTRSVTLDTVPPTLTVTYPPNALITNNEVINVTGSTEVSASLTVSGTLATMSPTSSAFTSWVLLRLGVNTIPIIATDQAGNTTAVSRTVTLIAGPVTRYIYLPLVLRNY